MGRWEKRGGGKPHEGHPSEKWEQRRCGAFDVKQTGCIPLRGGGGLQEGVVSP